jgi:hypothetical protein
MPLRRAAVGCHLLLIAAFSAALLPPLTPVRLATAAVLALPLLLTLRGLAQGRRTTMQRLAVLLVVYVGGSSVEVVARSGDAPAVSVALLLAVLELGLLLAVIRRSTRISQSARG